MFYFYVGLPQGEDNSNILFRTQEKIVVIVLRKMLINIPIQLKEYDVIVYDVIFVINNVIRIFIENHLIPSRQSFLLYIS